MPLSPSILGALIKTKRLAKLDPSQIVNNAALEDDCAAIAEAVIEHITAAGLVTVNPLGLVSPPGTAGGPVTGTATGTIT